jgi:putative phosphoribosyl transferase
VAYEVARALNASLDVLILRKIGIPGQPELAISAIESGNIVVHEPRTGATRFGSAFDRLVAKERRELRRREKTYPSSTSISSNSRIRRFCVYSI